MTKEQRAKSYEEFQSHYMANHPDSHVVWKMFEVVDALWSIYAYCLGRMGLDGFWLFLEHLAYVGDPKNKVSSDLLRSVSSMSEAGKSISFQISNETKILSHRWLSSSPYGNDIILLLDSCNAEASGGFIARSGGCFGSR